MPTELSQPLAALLCSHPELRIAILFGSLAKGEARPDSDLDLAVGAGKPLDAEAKMRLIGELAAVVGRPIDLIDLATVGEPLLGQILRDGIRLLDDRREYAELIKRHLFAEADFVPYQQRILAQRRRAWIGI